ncbi:MAG: hypothetical protein IH609_13900 [Dehalococcoidia bacterium]|nr:hypothetical protein [Dehalococcoidia bacterium]
MTTFERTGSHVQWLYVRAFRVGPSAPGGARRALALWLCQIAFVLGAAGCGAGEDDEDTLVTPVGGSTAAAGDESLCTDAAAAPPLTALVVASEAHAEALRSQLAGMEPPAFAGPHVVIAAAPPASERAAPGPEGQLWLAHLGGARVLDLRPRP